MARKRAQYVFTPARRAALAKARAARSAKSSVRRKTQVARTRKIYSSNMAKRGVGVLGAKKNFVPYARVNQRSQTGGFNVGTGIPGTGKRVVVGGYLRVENTRRGGVLSRGVQRAAPRGTRRGAAHRYFKENVTVTNPALRVGGFGGQARLTTSRGGGPTITVRRGAHKTPQKISRKGVNQYDLRTKKIQKKQLRKGRPQRRGK
jgi:hypothetical protein